jgi:hypothetical protein
MDVVVDSPDKRENFVFDKIKDSNVGDVSDAGMMYYLLTGDENADPVKLRAFLSQERKSVPIETVDKRRHDRCRFRAPTSSVCVNKIEVRVHQR